MDMQTETDRERGLVCRCHVFTMAPTMPLNNHLNLVNRTGLCILTFTICSKSIYFGIPRHSKAKNSLTIQFPFLPLITQHLNTLRPRQNGRHLADYIFKCIFLNENVWILIKIPLKFVLKGPLNNIPALVQIMAWRRPGDQPLSEPMMASLPTHICVTRLQWFNLQEHVGDV